MFRELGCIYQSQLLYVYVRMFRFASPSLGTVFALVLCLFYIHWAQTHSVNSLLGQEDLGQLSVGSQFAGEQGEHLLLAAEVVGLVRRCSASDVHCEALQSFEARLGVEGLSSPLEHSVVLHGRLVVGNPVLLQISVDLEGLAVGRVGCLAPLS